MFKNVIVRKPSKKICDGILLELEKDGTLKKLQDKYDI